MANFNIKDIVGVIPALITPFEEDESISEQKIRMLIENLIEQGVNGFYIAGSTGEGFLMSIEERKRVAHIAIDQVKGRVPVIVQVGTIAAKSAIELAEDAYKAGADAISSVPPFYYKFSFDEIYNYYSDVASATPLPLIVYSIPSTTGVDISLESIEKLYTIKNVKGIKYTSMNHYEMQRIKQSIGRDFMVYSGADEMCLSGILMGADGIIGSLYNVNPELYIKIYNNLIKNDIISAKHNMEIANDIIQIFLKYNYYPSLREALKWMGLDSGRCRRPFKKLNDSEVQNLKGDLLNLKNKKCIKGIRVLDRL